ncbi:hypothetical protein A2164_04390 [Candidatus Curtissbacteria bacterium RBG_13_35_7]|uniref:PIN domain-containing protein n=1 Tax=Candidatus Curtissbacteria bacterium RBG_13_35_7 TaxID=1797705 RepID=A0A1F5G0J6_9BACT|nr:MAG: hypothetical protein A2164_04390 [Candidatus Curtissbacteria bacterium RBG_13_35_7]
MKVFIDTSAFVALFIDKETYHEKIASKYYEYRQQRAIFFTSYYILDELFTRLSYYKIVDINKHIQKLKDAFNANELTVLQIDEALFEKSIEVFIKYAEHKISFTDATTYMLFKNYKLDEIFTLDKDFKKIRIATSF